MHYCKGVIDDVIFYAKLGPLIIAAGTSVESVAVLCVKFRKQEEGETDRYPWVLSHFVVKW